MSSREGREYGRATEGNRTLTRETSSRSAANIRCIYLPPVLISLHIWFVVRITKDYDDGHVSVDVITIFQSSYFPRLQYLFLSRNTHSNLPSRVSTQPPWLSLSHQSTQVRTDAPKTQDFLIAEAPCSLPVIPLLLAVLLRVVYTKASRTAPMSYNVKWGREKSVERVSFIRLSI